MTAMFNVGDVVALRAEVVRRTGLSGLRRGAIADFDSRDAALAIVEWGDGRLSHVHINNLSHPGANALFCGPSGPRD